MFSRKIIMEQGMTGGWEDQDGSYGNPKMIKEQQTCVHASVTALCVNRFVQLSSSRSCC